MTRNEIIELIRYQEQTGDYYARVNGVFFTDPDTCILADKIQRFLDEQGAPKALSRETYDKIMHLVKWADKIAHSTDVKMDDRTRDSLRICAITVSDALEYEDIRDD